MTRDVICAREDLREDARRVRRQMQDDEHGCREVAGECRDQVSERFDPACGCTDRDGVDARALVSDRHRTSV